MYRRDFARTISTASTASFVLDDFILTKPESSESDKFLFRRGVRGEIKIVVEKFEAHDEPRIKIFGSRDEQLHSIQRESNTPFCYVGDFQAIVYKHHPSGLKETLFLPYFNDVCNKVRGMWVTGDKAISQQDDSNE